MARRKKRFGAVATRPTRGTKFTPKRFSVAVSVMRTGREYSAVACPKLRLSPANRANMTRASNRANLHRCGNGRGGTPTAATKAALVALSRKLK